MNHVILADGRILSAADFAVAYLADPTLTCAVIVPEFSDAAGGSPTTTARRVGPLPAGSTATPSTGADNPTREVGTGGTTQGGK